MAYTEFFVTKGASAADINGGSMETGNGQTYTNDGPAVNRTNCSSDGAGTAITDDDAGGWGTAAVDDWICFDTAGTKDYARITNVAGDVLTVTPAVAAGVNTKDVHVGGAWATIDHHGATVTTAFVNAAGDPPKTYVGPGTYAEIVTLDNGGTNAIPISLEGYYATPGDDAMNGATHTPPTIDSTGKSGLGVIYTASAYLTVRNFFLTTNVNSDHGLYWSGNYGTLERLKITVTGTSSIGIRLDGNASAARNCWITDCAAQGIYMVDNYTTVDGCRIDSAGTIGVDTETFGQSVINTIINGSTDDCLFCDPTYPPLIDSCVMYGSVSGSGVRYDASPTATPPLTNCIIMGNNQYGIECDAALHLREDDNAFYNNGVAETLNVTIRGRNDVTLSGDPFTSAGTDFTLDDTAGQGAACRNAGFPGAMIDGTNIGYADIGSLRHEDPAGGGGGLLVHPGMAGGMRA